MIIRCPECSTGFKLPDERLSEDPIKVRCSKCKEVFRVGLVDDEAVRFDVDGNRIDEADDDDANQTQFGSPGAAFGADGSDDAASASTSDDTKSDTERGHPAADINQDDSDAADMKASDAAPDTDDESDDGARKETLMGTPAARPDEQQDSDESGGNSEPDQSGDNSTDQQDDGDGGRSKSSSPDYDPFPHANTGGSDDSSGDAVGGLSQASSDAIDASDDEQQDDPFADVLGEDESDDPSTEDNQSADDSESAQDSPSTSEPSDSESASSDDGTAKSTRIGMGAPSEEATIGGADASSDDAADKEDDLSDLEVGDDIPQDDDSFNQQQASASESSEPAGQATPTAANAATGGDAADDFDDDREFFDPDKGRVGPDGSPSGAASDAAAPSGGLAEGSAPSGPPQSGGPPGAGGPPDSASSTSASGSTSTGQSIDEDVPPDEQLDTVSTSEQTASQAATPAGPPESDWDVGGADRLDEAAYGSSWFQTCANVVLIALVLAGVALAVTAVRSGGVVDFRRMSHMLQIALHGDDFQPRDAWKESTTPITTGPDEPVEFNNVYASLLDRSSEGTDDSSSDSDTPNKWLVVRGYAKNLTDESINNLKVRVKLKNDNEKTIAETTAAAGQALADNKLLDAKSVDELQLDSASGVSIAPQRAKPFTVVFPNPPKAALDGSLVSYGVERVE